MPEKTTNSDIDDNRLVAAFSYIWVLCLIPLLLKRDSKFCQFHAKQGLVLFLGEVIITLLPFLWFLGIVFAIYAIAGFIQAMTGKFYRLPLVADFAEKFNF